MFKAVGRVAEASGLTLKLEDSDKPRTNGTVVYLPKLSGFATDEEQWRWLGAAYHELGHCSPEVKGIFQYCKDKSITGILHTVMNIIEDIRNERNGQGEYVGRDQALEYLQYYCAKQGVELLNKKGIQTDTQQLFIDVLVLSYKYRGDTFQPSLALPAIELAKFTKSDYSDLYPDLDAMVTEEDVHKIALKIIESVPEEQEQEQEQEQGADTDQGQDQDQENESEDSDKGQDEDKRIKDELGELLELIDQHEYHEPSGPVPRTPSERTEYFPIAEIEVRNPDPIDEKIEEHKKYILEMIDQGSTIEHQVKRLFQSQAQVQTVYNRTAGRLTKRDLYRVPAGDVDVFNRKQQNITPKGTALFLLVDGSGSMAYARWHAAHAAASLMVDALSPIGVATRVMSFTDDNGLAIHFNIKDWHERLCKEKMAERAAGTLRYLWDNADGESVAWAHDNLMTRPEKRKILIVLSDGKPATSNCDNRGVDEYLKEVIRKCKCEVYGIGIQTESVKDFYPEHTVIYDTTELSTKLLEVIKHKILG